MKYLYHILIFMAIVVFVSTQPVFRSTFNVLILNEKKEVFYPDAPDWEKASKELKKQISGKYTIVTSNDVKAAYYFGDYSFGLGPNEMTADSMEEFGLTRQTGRFTITNMKSFATVLSNCKNILFLVQSNHMNIDYQVPKDVSLYIQENGEKIDISTKGFYVKKFDQEIRNDCYNSTYMTIPCNPVTFKSN